MPSDHPRQPRCPWNRNDHSGPSITVARSGTGNVVKACGLGYGRTLSGSAPSTLLDADLTGDARDDHASDAAAIVAADRDQVGPRLARRVPIDA